MLVWPHEVLPSARAQSSALCWCRAVLLPAALIHSAFRVSRSRPSGRDRQPVALAAHCSLTQPRGRLIHTQTGRVYVYGKREREKREREIGPAVQSSRSARGAETATTTSWRKDGFRRRRRRSANSSQKVQTHRRVCPSIVARALPAEVGLSSCVPPRGGPRERATSPLIARRPQERPSA